VTSRVLTPEEIDGSCGYEYTGFGLQYIVTKPWGRAAAAARGLNPADEVRGHIEPGWFFTTRIVLDGPEAEP
jgi:hypothetical protein